MHGIAKGGPWAGSTLIGDEGMVYPVRVDGVLKGVYNYCPFSGRWVWAWAN